MCGSMRHRDAETTRNKLRTNMSHLHIVGQNRMNGSVRDASVLFQHHDGHSSIILNQLSHFFNPLNAKINPICHLLALLGVQHIFHVSGLRVNQRNSGNFLTALRIRRAFCSFCLLL